MTQSNELISFISGEVDLNSKTYIFEGGAYLHNDFTSF